MRLLVFAAALNWFAAGMDLDGFLGSGAPVEVIFAGICLVMGAVLLRLAFVEMGTGQS